MHLKIEPKKVVDAYSTPIVQQTSFWSKVKELLGMDSRAFDFSVRNSEIYTNVGGYAHTQGDFITFFQYLNTEDYIAYFPYGPEIEPLKLLKLLIWQSEPVALRIEIFSLAPVRFPVQIIAQGHAVLRKVRTQRFGQLFYEGQLARTAR